MTRPRLKSRDRQILALIQELGGATVADVSERYPEAVRAVIRRLIGLRDRGLISADGGGHGQPLVFRSIKDIA